MVITFLTRSVPNCYSFHLKLDSNQEPVTPDPGGVCGGSDFCLMVPNLVSILDLSGVTVEDRWRISFREFSLGIDFAEGSLTHSAVADHNNLEVFLNIHVQRILWLQGRVLHGRHCLRRHWRKTLACLDVSQVCSITDIPSMLHDKVNLTVLWNFHSPKEIKMLSKYILFDDLKNILYNSSTNYPTTSLD